MDDIPAERNRDDVKHARRIHCEWLLQGQEGDGDLVQNSSTH